MPVPTGCDPGSPVSGSGLLSGFGSRFRAGSSLGTRLSSAMVILRTTVRRWMYIHGSGNPECTTPPRTCGDSLRRRRAGRLEQRVDDGGDLVDEVRVAVEAADRAAGDGASRVEDDDRRQLGPPAGAERLQDRARRVARDPAAVAVPHGVRPQVGVRDLALRI